MAPTPRWRKILQIAAVSLVILAISFTTWVQIERHLLRARAERLLSDVRQLQLHNASWADIQAFRTRWKDWLPKDDNPPCTPAHCGIHVSTESPIETLLWKLGDQHPVFGFLGRVYSISQRSATATASLAVKDGVVSQSKFILFLAIFGSPSPEWPSGYGIFGHAEQHVAGFGPMDFIEGRMSHPEYGVGNPGGCEGCIKLVSMYTPLADRETILKLTHFNLACITRWTPCTSESDILPDAWKIYEQDAQGYEARAKAIEECLIPLQALGREYENASIADILSRQASRPTGSPYIAANLRVIRNLKGSMDWGVNSSQTASIYDRGQEIPGWSSTHLIEGKRYILLGSFGSDQVHTERKQLTVGDCGFIPYTEQNLSAIQRGIDESTAREIKLKQFEAGTAVTAQ